MANEEKLHPVHPGEALLEDFLEPMGLSQSRVALAIGVHPRRINEIVLRKRGISADTALRLAKFFGTSPDLWLGLQKDYELDVAMDEVGRPLTTRWSRPGQAVVTKYAILALAGRAAQLEAARRRRLPERRTGYEWSCPSRMKGEVL